MRRWNQLKGALEALGVGDVVAISPDTVDEASAFMAKHPDWKLTLLTDAPLQVTDTYNLRSHKTLALGLGRSMVRYLAIPTTLLVDADGIVRWVDQADDFRVRSDPRRVLDEIARALGRRAPAELPHLRPDECPTC